MSKKQSSKTSIFELPWVKNCISRLCTGPFTRPLLVEIAISLLWHGQLTGPPQSYRLQKTSFRILVGIYCHNIPTHTPQGGYHVVTEVAKTTNIPKMAEKCVNRIALVPLRPIQTLWSRDPETLFRLKIEKNQKIRDFRPKKRGGHFLTPPPPPSLKTSKKWVSSGGG